MELQLKVESLCLFAWLLVSDSHYDAIPDAIDTNRMVSRFRSWYATWISVSDMKHGWIAICRWIARFFTRDWPSWSRSKMDQVMRRPIRENPKNKNKKDKGSGNEPIVSLPIEPSMTHTLSSILLSSSLFIHVLLSSIPPKHFSLFLGLLNTWWRWRGGSHSLFYWAAGCLVSLFSTRFRLLVALFGCSCGCTFGELQVFFFYCLIALY